MNTNTENIECLEKLISQLNMTDIVYGSDDEFIIVFRFLSHTTTNEDRPVFNKNTATYIANALHVFAIYNKFTGEHCIEFGKYCCGSNIVSNKSTEIVYYKTIERAYYQNIDDYATTGTIKKWFLNGCLDYEGYMNDGLRTGEWIYYYNLGTQKAVGQFVNDKEDGEWNFKNNLGEVVIHGRYNLGIKTGEWIEHCGERDIYNTYIDNVIHTVTIRMNGKKTKMCIFGDISTTVIYDVEENINKKTVTDHKKHFTTETEWYSSGNIKSEVSFRDRQRSGVWKFYKDNENHEIDKEFDYESKNYE
jgi:antitoxin component YwqK of YwqJK toxin-antitoxin module